MNKPTYDENKIQVYQMPDQPLLVTTVKQRGVAEELCIDPVKFDRLICNFALDLSNLFEHGDEPLNSDETEAVADCVLDILNYMNEN